MAIDVDKPLAGLKVLLAEDSWLLADSMRHAIERAGGTVVGPAGTLPQAEELAASSDIDVAVMDLDLHAEMAYGLIRKLADAGVRVIVVSGNEPPPSIAARLQASLVKPTSVAAIIAAVSGVPR